MDIGFPADEIAATDDPGGRASDHRRVVGAIREPWIGNRHARPTELQNLFAESITEPRIGRYATGEECKAALDRHLITVKAINDSWSGDAFERVGDSGTIHYYPSGIEYARVALRCVEQ